MNYHGHPFPAVGVLALALVLAAVLNIAQALAGEHGRTEDWRNLYLDAIPVLDLRYRFEFVDQAARPKNARANTLRTRAGFQTGRFYGFGLGFDAEWIEAIGSETFNNTTNSRTRYPVVADPDDEEINQLFIVSENTVPYTRLKLGRQKIIWDNSRFIGNVGFRQNEQTFDAFRGTVTAIPDMALEYAYLDEVRRIFGGDSSVGHLGLRSHGIRGQYSGLQHVTITPFVLLLDFNADSQAGLDSQSYGILLEGRHPFGENCALLYEGSLAYQADHADNPADFDHWYYRIEPGIAYGKIKLKLGFESLEGDGTTAFQTPLATLHKFNGLTDQFLTTPPDGLEDLYLLLNAPLPGKGWLSGLNFKAGYHQFWAEQGGAHYGWEWDAGIFKKIDAGFGSFNLGIQYASYDADRFSSDTDKLWLTLQLKAKPKPLRDYL